MSKSFTMVSSHASPGTPVSAEDIGLQGEAFHNAIMVLSSQTSPAIAPSLGAPIMVLSAFAIEVWLKCVLFIENGKLEHGHLIFDLFQKLSQKSQDRLEELWRKWLVKHPHIAEVTDENGNRIALNLKTALKAGNDSFRQLRYLYENKNRPVFVLHHFIPMIRQLVTELKPEWFPK